MAVMSKSRIIGAIEIGTAKVAVLVGEITNGRSLSIIGMGQCSSRGVVKGEIVDFAAATDCAHAAILAAEKRAGVRIDGVYLAQTGGHLAGFMSEEGVTVSAADNRVGHEDIERVKSLAKEKQLPPERTIIHHIRRPFRLDGRIEPNPLYLEGKRLEVGYWTVHGQASKVSDHIHVINGFSLHVDDIILSSLASGVMVTTQEERNHGVLVLDIGRGTTDYALYQDGHCHVAGVVPVGGDHLTNDLSVGLRLTSSQAETLKLRFGSAVLQCRDRTERVWLNGNLSIGDRQVSRHSIERILSLRVSELFEVVRRSLGSNFVSENLGAGVVLTGGTSRLPMIDRAAQEVFKIPVRLGENPGMHDEVKQPEYSTVLGLLNYGLNFQGENDAPPTRKRGGVFGRILNLVGA
ncbi:MAG: cell division protein FtsA [Opitutaceae bacterium]